MGMPCGSLDIHAADASVPRPGTSRSSLTARGDLTAEAHVCAAPTVERVGLVVPVHDVIAGAATDGVVPEPSGEMIGARVTADHVVLVVAVRDVVAAPTVDPIDPATAVQGIVARTAEQRVRVVPGVDRIVPQTADETVRPVVLVSAQD